MSNAGLLDLANLLVEFGQADPVDCLFTMLRLAVVVGGCFSFAVLMLMTAVQLTSLLFVRQPVVGRSLITRSPLPSLLTLSDSASRTGVQGARGGF